MTLPTPHGDKLEALLQNDKLPKGDHKRIDTALARYRNWLHQLSGLPSHSSCVSDAVQLLHEYRMFLDLEVVFDSEHDF